MKKVLVIVLVSFVLISSVFTAGTEKTGEATLVLNFDEQKLLVGNIAESYKCRKS